MIILMNTTLMKAVKENNTYLLKRATGKQMQKGNAKEPFIILQDC